MQRLRSIKKKGLTETGTDAEEPGCSREERRVQKVWSKTHRFSSLTKCGNAVGGIFPAAKIRRETGADDNAAIF